MASLSNIIRMTNIPKQSSKQELIFNWVIVCLGLWMIGGAHLYVWVGHQIPVETYFSFWRSLWYSGYASISTVLFWRLLFSLKKGRSWRGVIPAGYEFSLAGVVVFLVGALGDLSGYKMFNTGVRFLDSLDPWHTLLAAGSVLIISGPIRATRIRTPDENQKWVMLMPAILSLALLLAEFSFFASQSRLFSNTILGMGPLVSTDGQVVRSFVAGINTVLLQSALLIGVILYAIQRWRLPIGGITLIIAIAYGLTVSIHENFLFAPFEILAGVSIEFLYWWLKPMSKKRFNFRWFAFGVPVIFYSYYFLTLAFTTGAWGMVHIWAGAILLSGIAGWLVSFVFLSPHPAGNETNPKTSQSKK